MENETTLQQRKVFLDSNVWIEILAFRTPVKPHEILQTQLASNLMKSIKGQNNIIICTCHQQLIEIIHSIQKVKFREFNTNLKSVNKKCINSMKEFRAYPDFKNVSRVCKMAIEDIKVLAQINNQTELPIDEILDNMHLVDITDYIFYDYCKNNDIELYTFDKELKDMDSNNIVTLLQ